VTNSLYSSGLLALLFCVLGLGAPLRADDVPVEKVFAAVPFSQWVKQGPQASVPWKVRLRSNGLSVHQRLQARIEVELSGRNLVRRPQDGRIVVLVQVMDAAGQPFRDYSLLRMKNLPPEIRKKPVILSWDMFVLPGEYSVTIVLVDDVSLEHNLMQGALRIEPTKNDPLPGAWAGLPSVEFWTPGMEGPDSLFRSDITGKLHLPLITKHPVRMELLADVTASDLFRGSTRFYNRYLSVALPLLKALSQISLDRGSLNVAMLDLRRRRVTFEQDSVKELDWPHAKTVLAPENGPAMIDIVALEQRRESPVFLQDELLRRLNAGAKDPPVDADQTPPAGDAVHIFVVIGSPMDFYSFRNLPRLTPGREKKCIVYYLQFELLNTQYADGALGSVRNMLKPLPVRTFKVRSAESIRHALAKILEEVANM
jgi:hypothetical protein